MEERDEVLFFNFVPDTTRECRGHYTRNGHNPPREYPINGAPSNKDVIGKESVFLMDYYSLHKEKRPVTPHARIQCRIVGTTTVNAARTNLFTCFPKIKITN
jgi:hypothetical protein